VGIGKTDREPIRGHGILGEIRFIVEEDLNGFRSLLDLLKIPVSLKRSSLLVTGEDVTSLRTGQTALYLTSEPEDQDELGVYPNPTSDQLNLREQINSYRIFDSKGVLIMQQNLPDPISSIDVRQLHAGLYLLRTISIAGEVKVARFAVIK
jgi:hypothetical protein